MSSEAKSPDIKETLSGSCHCGAVTFQLEHKPLEETEVTCCNCSICNRNGYLLIYPQADDFKLLTGEDKLTSYQFGGKNTTHKFCSTCGTSVYIDARDKFGRVAMNVRTFPDLDIDKLKLKNFDGRTLL